MSVEITLRPARPADLPAILALDPGSASDLRRSVFIDAALYSGWITVALVDEAIVGFAATHRHFFSRPFLALLVVDPAFRRQGVARRLIVQAIEVRGELWTSTNASNAGAQALFAALGFVRAGNIEGFDANDPELIYRRVDG